MAGMLQKLGNPTPPMTQKSPFQSRKQNFLSCAHIVSVYQTFDPMKTMSLHPQKFHSVPRTLIIRNTTNLNKGNGGEDSSNQELVRPNRWLSVESVLKFATNNLLPLALVGGIAFALANPDPGCFAHRHQLPKFSVIGIFVISVILCTIAQTTARLTLRSQEISEAAEAWPVGLFGLASILLLTPLLSRSIVLLRLQPQEFVTGLALYNCMPTAISSGVALTKLAGGNSALALAMTVLSSLLGVLIVPFSISKLLVGKVGASVPADKMFKSLIVTVLIPLILGKVFRDYVKGVADIVDSNRKLLSTVGSILLSLIPWVQLSKSRPLLLTVKPQVVLVAVLMGVYSVLHIVLLCFNFMSIHILCGVSGGSKSIFAKKENYRALLLVASQKTVAVLVAVVEQLDGTYGEAGLLVLPCVAAHISQVIIDSLIVGYWNRKKQPLATA